MESVGDPAERVVAKAADYDADFVVVGGRHQSSARRALFGSVSQEIIESVRCPVISVREGVYERPSAVKHGTFARSCDYSHLSIFSMSLSTVSVFTPNLFATVSATLMPVDSVICR
ncbi:universal stress protein [Halalkalicoccus paucihalophilus]|uniref:universal stress protein n=1 Tax=Halalkalicoccus paucihalophilus TaxID=1008153 RepID=UPI001FDFCF6E|nr:universal stress protein [Halalkalicoccus paucihalophilus]